MKLCDIAIGRSVITVLESQRWLIKVGRRIGAEVLERFHGIHQTLTIVSKLKMP